MPPTPSCARVHRKEKKAAPSQLSTDWVMWAQNCQRMPKYWTFWTRTFRGCQQILSVSLVTSDFRTQLAHLPAQQVEDILSLLGGFEKTVFETRTMSLMPPVRKLDMDITETADARPVAMRHYPVAPQHMPELERQIKALLDAGIIRESVSLYASPVFFAPKKDDKLRLCVDYRRLNR